MVMKSKLSVPVQARHKDLGVKPTKARLIRRYGEWFYTPKFMILTKTMLCAEELNFIKKKIQELNRNEEW